MKVNPTSCLTWEKMENGCIAYDYDDVLYPFFMRVVRKMGWNYGDVKDFHLDSNPALPRWEVEQAVKYMYSDETFREIDFFPGVEDILRPQLEFGVRVIINTNSVSEKAHQMKFEQLQAKVPELTWENYHGGIVTHDTSRQKLTYPGTQIFVDDSPYNIAMSTASLNIMRQMPWNMTPKAQEQVQDKNPLWFMTLREIVNFNYETVKRLHAACKKPK